MKTATILAALLMTASVHAAAPAGEQPVTTVAEDAQGFDTVQAAAVAGLTVANTLAANGNEFCGAVIETDGKFYATTPVTNDKTGACYYRVAIRKGSHLVAMYHVHPKTELENVAGNKDEWRTLNDQSLVFSPVDIECAAKINIPSYIYFQVSGETRVFVPGTTRTENRHHDDGRMGTNKVSKGDKLS
jgi:hypothetical protein